MNSFSSCLLTFKDEAAGVMEGILDLGIAGFKKGLRLTGLQESLNESSKVNANNYLMSFSFIIF